MIAISEWQKWAAFLLFHVFALLYLFRASELSLMLIGVVGAFDLLFIVSDRVLHIRGSGEGVVVDVREAARGLKEELAENEIAQPDELNEDEILKDFGGAETAADVSRIASDLTFRHVLEAIARREGIEASEREELFKTKGLSRALDVIYRAR